MKTTAALSFALLAASAGPLAASPAPYVLQQGHIDLERGPDGNTVILDAPRGLVVVDTGRHPEHSARIVDYARAAGKPVMAVVNTHWHLDHTTGNRDVLAAYPQAIVVASRAVEGALSGFLARSRESAVKALADPDLPERRRAGLLLALAAIDDRAALAPRLAITHDSMIRLGGRRMEFHLARNAATEGDVWLVLPDEKLAVVGDLVVAAFPFFDTGCEEGWSAALDAIGKAKWTTLVPGHGEPMQRADFNRWRVAFNSLLDCAKSQRPAADCAVGWEHDAAGFFTPAQQADVHAIGIYYVEQVLRAPRVQRMAYCRTKEPG